MTSFAQLSADERESAISNAAVRAGALSYLTGVAHELGVGLCPSPDELLKMIYLEIKALQADRAYLNYLSEPVDQ